MEIAVKDGDYLLEIELKNDILTIFIENKKDYHTFIFTPAKIKQLYETLKKYFDNQQKEVIEK